MSFSLKIDPRSAAYVRLIGDIYDMINDVVKRREKEGVTRAEIARRMGKDRSQLSRILNGHSSNITARTIADILYATDFELDRPAYHPLEADGCNAPSATHTDLAFKWIAGEPIAKLGVAGSNFTKSDGAVHSVWQHAHAG